MLSTSSSNTRFQLATALSLGGDGDRLIPATLLVAACAYLTKPDGHSYRPFAPLPLTAAALRSSHPLIPGDFHFPPTLEDALSAD